MSDINNSNLPKPPKMINKTDVSSEAETENEVEEEDKENDVELLEKTLTKNADKPENKDKVVMKDYFKSSEEDYEDFDKKAWSKGKGYIAPDYPIFTDKLEGIDEGLYVFAGESNSGKSAVMMNIMKNICSYRDNHLFGVYYSLDDTKNIIIARVIAMDQKIPISVASKPRRYQDLIDQGDNDSIQIYENYLKKREQGLNQLKAEKDLFKVVDTEDIKNQTDLVDHLKNVQTFVKSINPKNNIIAAIDSIKDINLDYRTNSDNQKSEDIARLVKQQAVDLHIPIFASCHMRKLNGNRRPILDDLKDANTLVYESSVVFLIHNDISKNKNASNIFWQDNLTEDEEHKGPVIEMDWAKNKLSSYKGRTFLKFQPYFSKTYECDKDESRGYETLIYQS